MLNIKNSNELLKIKLMMKYNTSKTLTENTINYGNLFFEFDDIKNIIFEQSEKDLEKLEQTGFKLIEKFIVKPYTMILLYNGYFYQISLTTNDDEFTTFDSQIKKSPEHNSNFLKIGKKLINKLKEWSWSYGTLYVGSFNKSRTEKYKRIFNILGLNIGDIHYMPPSDAYAESWFFAIPDIKN
jgi:hypothetical protein